MSDAHKTGIKLALISFLITVFLLATVLFLGSTLNDNRESDLNKRFERMSQDFNSMQTFSLLSETYDDKMACLAFESKLQELNSYIWKLGQDIDNYRTASEEFQKNQYYVQQKKIFNENEVYYYLLLRKMEKKCSIKRVNILFFYKNAVDCKKCDDQSFILSDISKMDDDNKKEIAVFSYDVDLNISTINLLAKYYDVHEFPCMVINETPYCGIQDKNFIMKKVCTEENLYLCSVYFKENTQSKTFLNNTGNKKK